MAGAGGVLVVGSINVDLVTTVARLPGPGETVAGGTFARHGGGKGANQAVAAARWGAPVRLVGAVGDDELGEPAVAELAAAGVATGAVLTLAGTPTGVAAIVVDAGGENQIAVASGANAALDGARVDAALAGLAPLDEAVCLLNLEVPDGALVAAARAASAAGMVLVVDPAPARALPDALLDARPVLVPNEGEARELTGRADAEAAGRALAARTGAPVVVTRGAAGALLVDGGDAVAIAAPRVRAVDTTGAGDTLSGVLAAELARATPLAEAVAVAVRAAAAATRVRGARAGMPRPGELAGLG